MTVISTTPISSLLEKLDRVVQTSDRQWEARCPIHDDHTNSLCIGLGSDGTVLLKCQAGCQTTNLLEHLGLTMKDLFPKGNGKRKKIIATYDYRDRSGKLLYQVCRFDPKDFRQRRPNPAGGWSWKLNRVPRVLYRLPELREADPSETVFLVEGEKDADRLRSLGLVVTCNAGGAGKWKSDYSNALKGRHVVVLPDNDQPGRQHAAKVAAALQGVCRSVKILELPGLPNKGDISDWLDDGHTANELQELTKVASEWKPEAEPPASTRTQIEVTPDEWNVNDQAVQALGEDLELFQRGGRLVHVLRDGFTFEGIDRPENAPRVVDVPEATLREKLSQHAEFVKRRRKGNDDVFERVHVPDWCVRAVAARGSYPGIRPLTGIAENCVLRPNGTLVTKPGYDPQTGLYLECTEQRMDVPERPTRTDAIEAAETLLDLVCDFPFSKPEHRSAWLAGLLTPLGRISFHGPAPLFLFDANVRGSGKSLLTDIIAQIVTGREMSRMSNPRDDDECRKRITSLAILGDPLVLIDNINSAFGGAAIDAALTATVWKDRMLGQSRIVEHPLRMAWYATGNNVVLLADTSRRVCHVRLESHEENPEDRTGFKYPDLKRHVQEHRRDLLAKALTILRAWFVAGKPTPNLKPWGSFEAWSNTVRACIVWLGLPDPGHTREELRNRSDNDAAALAGLIEGWQEIDPDGRGLTAAEALKILDSDPNRFSILRESVIQLCENRAGKVTTRSLGKRLQHVQDRVVGGRTIDRKEGRGRQIFWFVQNLTGEFGEFGECVSTSPMRAQGYLSSKSYAGVLPAHSPNSPHSPSGHDSVTLCSECGFDSGGNGKRCATCEDEV